MEKRDNRVKETKKHIHKEEKRWKREDIDKIQEWAAVGFDRRFRYVQYGS